MYQTLRYRPVQSMGYSPANPTAVKNIAFIYPLLNVFFRLPRAWIVEDRDYGLIRMVPATNTQMLPLWAMQLAFMGFAESLPNGLWFQYTAGLTPNDYNSRFSFMKELVLAEAALTALNSIQGTINLGELNPKLGRWPSNALPIRQGRPLRRPHHANGKASQSPARARHNQSFRLDGRRDIRGLR